MAGFLNYWCWTPHDERFVDVCLLLCVQEHLNSQHTHIIINLVKLAIVLYTNKSWDEDFTNRSENIKSRALQRNAVNYFTVTCSALIFKREWNDIQSRINSTRYWNKNGTKNSHKISHRLRYEGTGNMSFYLQQSDEI